MKSQLKKTITTTLALMTITTAVLPVNQARADAVDTAVSMSSSMLQVLLGKGMAALIFPSASVDYDRIRKDMADVTRQAITEGVITQAEGQISGAENEAYAIIGSRTMESSFKITKLNTLRQSMARDINGISKGQFAKPGLAHYMTGAQAELSMLTAMKTYAHDAAIPNEEAYAIAMLRVRINELSTQISTTKVDILKDRHDERVHQFGDCWFQGIEPNYPYSPRFAYKDNLTGKTWEMLKLPDINFCRMVRDQTANEYGNAAAAAVNNQIGWMDKVVSDWRDSLKALPPGADLDNTATQTQQLL